MPNDDRTRVIGVFGHSGPGKVLRFEDACIIADSGTALRQYDSARGPHRNPLRISKIRFGEIHDGLISGAAYAFDRIAYARFFVLARRSGIDDLEGFPDHLGEPGGLMKVKFQPDGTTAPESASGGSTDAE